MKNTIKVVTTIVAGIGAFAFLNSCTEKKGPAEKMGEKMDDAVEEAGDKIEEATDK